MSKYNEVGRLDLPTKGKLAFPFQADAASWSWQASCCELENPLLYSKRARLDLTNRIVLFSDSPFRDFRAGFGGAHKKASTDRRKQTTLSRHTLPAFTQSRLPSRSASVRNAFQSWQRSVLERRMSRTRLRQLQVAGPSGQNQLADPKRLVSR